MNCVRCNAPLDEGARFCRNCGLLVAASEPQTAIRLPPPPLERSDATLPVSPPSQQSWFTQQPYQQEPPYTPVPTQSTVPVSSPQPYSQAQAPAPPPLDYANRPARGVKIPPAAVNSAPRRRRGGCILGCLSALIILLVVFGLAWVFALRPYLHNMANTQIDRAMSAAVSQIPNEASRLRAGPLPVKENTLNNLLVLNIAPSDPVQNTNMLITPGGVRLDFQLYGQPCTITGVPQARSGKLVASKVTVSGIIGLIMSPDEITSLLNRHLADAQARINRPISGVHLMSHEMDLILG